MTTDSNESYVRRIARQSARYMRDLLRENQELRDLATQLDAERLRLSGELESVAVVAAENRELRARVETLAADLNAALRQLSTTQQQLVVFERQKAELTIRLQDLRSESRRHLEDYLEVEQQNTNLVNLYVAGYRLHSTLDRAEVLAGLQEIIVNLVGSEELAILELDEQGGSPRIVNRIGLEASTFEHLPAEVRARIEDCLRTGQVWTAEGQHAESTLTACIPLTVDGRAIGAIAVFRLLQQKQGIDPLDRELFGLLVTHAATALYCTSLHAARVNALAVM